MTSPTLRRSARATAFVGALVLAVPLTASAHVVVAPGETLSDIAAEHGVSTDALAQANGLADPHLIVDGMSLALPTGSDGSAAAHHVVRSGEVLSQIAASKGVSVTSLAQVNGIRDPDRIRSGTRLVIDGTAAIATTTTGATRSTTNRSSAQQLITTAAQRHGWQPAIPLGLAMQESGWNNSVVSARGAIGLMQVLPATGEWVGAYLLGRDLDLNDPADNVAAGMAYLDYLNNRFDGELDRALAAYYEGPQRVTDRGPSAGGQRYAANVKALAQRYR